MLSLKIRCPKCGKINHYSFGDGIETFHIGDYVDDKKDKTCLNEYKGKCLDCYEEFDVLEVIDKSKILNVLINPSKIELEKISYKLFPELEEYPDADFALRACLYLGEESSFIPSQMSVDNELNLGDVIPIFNKNLTVVKKYKLKYSTPGYSFVYAMVYELECDLLKRLLILRDNYLPIIKEVIWSTDDYVDESDKMKRFCLPTDCELILCSQ